MTEVFKRPALPLLLRNEAKRARVDEGAVVLAEGPTGGEPRRVSQLAAPNMLLTGHAGEIFAARFSPDGNCLASAGFDQKILLWNVYGDCENFSYLAGHTGAVTDLHFSADSSHLYSCSTDRTVRVWDMETGTCLRKFKSHTDFVNSCHPARRGPELICSGSDDGTIAIHDVRKKEPAFRAENSSNKYQVTAVSFGDLTDYVVSGGIDNVIKIWDVRRVEPVYFLPGHTDTVTGLALSPDGNHVLSNSIDCSARIWDIRPYANAQRCVKILTGHQHNFEKNLLKCSWSADGRHVGCGSSDRFSYVWNATSGRIVYKLPGHQGSVNAIDFHPHESILLTGGSDKLIYLGELAY